MLRTGLWIAVVGFLLELAAHAFWTLASFNNDWYIEDWYRNVTKTFQVVETFGTAIVILGLVLAASGAGRAVRGGRPGPAMGAYGAPGQPYAAPAGSHQQQQPPWAQAPQAPQSPQQWGGPPQGPPPSNG
jgi:hypothetical protein